MNPGRRDPGCRTHCPADSDGVLLKALRSAVLSGWRTVANMLTRLERRWDARAATKFPPRRVNTPEETRAAWGFALGFIALVALFYGLPRLAAYMGAPSYVGLIVANLVVVGHLLWRRSVRRRANRTP